MVDQLGFERQADLAAKVNVQDCQEVNADR
jgi:hypothetical protein